MLVRILCYLCVLIGFESGFSAQAGVTHAKSSKEEVTPSLERIETVLGAVRFDDALLMWPVAGQHRISSQFGYRDHPLKGKKVLHRGLDIAAKRGTPIVAIAPGKVTFVGARRGFGRMVEVSHVGGWISKYAHANTTIVALGQAVLAGQMIARVGSSGHATGPHLHLEIRRAGKPIDPLPLLRQKLVLVEP